MKILSIWSVFLALPLSQELEVHLLTPQLGLQSEPNRTDKFRDIN